MKNRIEEIRKQKGIRQEDFARSMGVSCQTISSLETGRYNPSIQLAYKIARYFDVSLFYLKGETDDRTSQENWMKGDFGVDDEPMAPIVNTVAKKVKPAVQSSGGSNGVFEAFRSNKAFQDMIRDTVLDVLRSPEGQEILTRVIKKELKK